MVLAEVGDNHHAAQHSLDSLAGTLGKNKRIWTLFDQSIAVHMLKNGALGVQQKVTFPPAPYFNVLERIVRGLYWHIYKSPLGLQTDVTVFPKRPNEQQWILLRLVWASLEWHSLNSGTFKFGHTRADDGSTVWVMEFFGSVLAYAVAHTPR